MMTVKDVRRRLRKIKKLSKEANSAEAHYAVDHLHKEVLSNIAAGIDGAAELARLALRTEDMGYTAWYE